MGRRRILWISKGLDQGGAESLLFDLVTRPEFSGFEIEVAYVSSTHHGMRSQFEAQGVAVYDLGAQTAWDFRWITRLRRLQHDRNYALIHAHSPLPASAVRLLFGRRAVPRIVTTEHNLDSAYRRQTRLLNRITGHLDDAAFGVSDAVTRDHATRRRPVERLYHGRAKFTGGVGTMALDLDPTLFQIVLIANLRPEKNIENLLMAMSRARHRVQRLALTIVGDGMEREHLEDLTTQLGLDDSVTFRGQIPNAREVLPAFDLLVLSSRREGLPVVVMEALQAGVPVVSTSVGGIPELVVDGESGLLVPPGDADRLADALVRVATEQGLRDSLAAGALAASRVVDVAPAARRYAEIYRSLLGLSSADA